MAYYNNRPRTKLETIRDAVVDMDTNGRGGGGGGGVSEILVVGITEDSGVYTLDKTW